MKLAMALPLVISAAPESPRMFVERVIAYETSARADMTSRAFDAFLTPRLRNAIRRDMQGNEVRVLDFDPICQCQDDDGLKIRVLSLVSSGEEKIAALSISGAEPQKVVLHLARKNTEWRIADISTAAQPSLLRALERSNRNVR